MGTTREADSASTIELASAAHAYKVVMFSFARSTAATRLASRSCLSAPFGATWCEVRLHARHSPVSVSLEWIVFAFVTVGLCERVECYFPRLVGRLVGPAAGAFLSGTATQVRGSCGARSCLRRALRLT